MTRTLLLLAATAATWTTAARAQDSPLTASIPAPAPSSQAVCATSSPTRLTSVTFRAVLDSLASGWNTNRPALAARCFTATAVYLEPPDRQVYRGRAALEEFFRASVAPARADRMTWHHVAFDESTQVGFAEYTYVGQRYYHGVVVIRMADGLIASWREYQYPSPQPWDAFVGSSR